MLQKVVEETICPQQRLLPWVRQAEQLPFLLVFFVFLLVSGEMCLAD